MTTKALLFLQFKKFLKPKKKKIHKQNEIEKYQVKM